MSLDERLRQAGWRITARPNGEEPTWTLYSADGTKIATMKQSQAEKTLAKYEKEHRPKGTKAVAIALLLLIILTAAASAKPDKELPKKLPKGPAIAFPEKCQYGEIKSDGKSIIIKGTVWLAQGKVREDGSIFLLWTHIDSGRIGPSIYRVVDERIVGLWGWADEVVEQDGDLTGSTRPDTIRGE